MALSALPTRARMTIVCLSLAASLYGTGAGSGFDAVGAEMRPRIRASVVAVGTEISARGTVTGSPRGARAALQERRNGRWVTRAMGALTVRQAQRTFWLTWRGASPEGHTIRVALFAGKRIVSAQARRSVRAGRALAIRRTLRSGTLQARPGAVRSISGDPDSTQEVVLARGTRVPDVGGVLLVAPSSNAPSGIIGRVQRRTPRPGGTVAVNMTPATLDEAYRELDAQIDGTLGQLAASSEAREVATASSVNIGALDVSFTCDSSSVQRTITKKVDLSQLRLQASVVLPSWSTGFNQGVSFVVAGQPKLRLGVGFSGKATCKANAAVSIPIAQVPGLVVTIGPQFVVSATGSVGVQFDWTPYVTVGFNRFKGTAGNNYSGFSNAGSTSFTGAANLTMSFALKAGMSLGGRVGVNGTVGPDVAARARADFLTGRTCLTADAGVSASLTAFARAFFLDWTFTLGTWSSPRRQLYSACAGSGTGAPAPTPGGGDGSSSGGGSASPDAFDRITALTPTTGPLGFEPGFAGPACRPQSGDEWPALHVAANGSALYTSYWAGLQDDGWRSTLATGRYGDLAAGTYRFSFRCVLSKSDGSSRVGWEDPGFDVTLTGTQADVNTESHTVNPGGTVRFYSGATQGPQPCPVLQGATLHNVWLGLYGPGGGAPVVDGTFQLPSGTSSLTLTAPTSTQPGTTLMAAARCNYSYGGPPSGASMAYAFGDASIEVTP